jgi:hypothetical protein
MLRNCNRAIIRDGNIGIYAETKAKRTRQSALGPHADVESQSKQGRPMPSRSFGMSCTAIGEGARLLYHPLRSN